MATLTQSTPQDVPALAISVANETVRQIDRSALSRRLAAADARRFSTWTVGAVISANEIRALTDEVAHLDALLAACPIHVARARFAEFRRDLAKILSAVDSPA